MGFVIPIPAPQGCVPLSFRYVLGLHCLKDTPIIGQAYVLSILYFYAANRA